MRRGLVWIVLGCLVVPLADLGVWTQRTVLDTDRFSALSDDLLAREPVREALAERIIEEVGATASPVDLQPLVAAALGTPEFERVFASALRELHGQLVRDEDRLTLDLTPGLDITRQRLAEVAPRVADALPATLEIVIAEQDQAPYLWAGAQAARWGSVVAIGIAFALLGVGVAVADRRWVALGVAGIGVAAVSLAFALLVAGAQEVAARWASTRVDRAAFDASWDVLEERLLVQTLIVAIAGVSVAILGFVAEATLRPRRSA